MKFGVNNMPIPQEVFLFLDPFQPIALKFSVTEDDILLTPQMIMMKFHYIGENKIIS